MKAADLDQWCRDLRWAILSPSPCRPQRAEMPAPSWFQRFIHALPLARWRPSEPPPGGGRTGTKVGLYFEWLWQQALLAHPDYQLLASNLAIEANRRTLGSLDLLLYDHRMRRHEHWELAIKFYLGLDNSHGFEGWIGAGLNDRLDCKWQRLWAHQLPLSDHPAARTALAEWNIGKLARRLIFKGIFFRNPDVAAAPWWLAPVAPSPHWLTLGQFRRQAGNGRDSGGYRSLTKPYWLAPAAADASLSACVPEKLQLDQGPIQLLEIVSGRRLYVVPDDWPARARAVLPDLRH